MIKRKVYLHGALGEQFGAEHTFFTASVNGAVRAMQANYPGFVDVLRTGKYHIINGDLETGQEVTETDVWEQTRYKTGDFHFIPAVAGGKENSWISIVIGVVLIAATYGASAAYEIPAWVANVGYGLGASLTLSGISGMLSPMPTIDSYDDREAPDERASFMFDGPINRTEQGGAVPVVLGEVITGSTVIGGAIDTEDF